MSFQDRSPQRGGPRGCYREVKRVTTLLKVEVAAECYGKKAVSCYFCNDLKAVG